MGVHYWLWYFGRHWKWAASGMVHGASSWMSVVGAGLLALVLQRSGINMPVPLGWPGVLITGATAWALIFVARLFLLSPFRVWSDGTWHGNKFVYHEAVTALSKYVSPKDNNKIYKFRFPAAPPNGTITYEIATQHASQRIHVEVGPHHYAISQPEDFADISWRYSGGSFRMNTARELYYKTVMHPASTPSSIWIRITAWEIPRPKKKAPAETDGTS
jgi:hypothetical protein